MEHLSTLDAGFLEAEDADRHVSLAIGGLAILDGPPPDFETLVANLDERARSIPRCTQVLRTHSFDLAAPQWVDDPQFNIAHHVRRVALPQPGDEAALFRVVADAMERRLDRDRPMWESWVIEGLADDQWAILTKIHHCIADGVSATALMTELCDDGEGGTFVTALTSSREQTAGQPPSSRPSLNPLVWTRDALQLSVALVQAGSRIAAGAVEIASGLLRPATETSLTGPLTSLRRYAAVHVPLGDVVEVCRRFEVTINDVALAAITESFRAALIRRGQEPQSGSMRTLVPVSVRSASKTHTPDNRVSLLLPCLPVEHSDPVEQLRAVHTRLAMAKGGGQRQAASIVMWAAGLIPFALSAWTVRLLTRLPQRGVVTVATNVPGPRDRLRVMGHDVVHLLPIPPIALGIRTGVAILSYEGELTFGVTVDYDAAADVSELALGIQNAVARLVAAGRADGPATRG